MDKLWNAVNTCLEDTLSVPNFQIFKSSTEPISFSNNVLKLKVNSHFSKGWIREKCEPILKLKFLKTDYNNLIIEFVVEENIESSEPPPQMQLFKSSPHQNTNVISQFNPNLTFENFIVGSNNRFAHAAAQAVSTKPAKAYNPLLTVVFIIYIIFFEIIKTSFVIRHGHCFTTFNIILPWSFFFFHF